jgi:RNA polymerase sigma factor (sigma-70 family)
MAAGKPEHLDAFRKNPRSYLYKAAINEALHVKDGLSRQRISDEDVEMLEILTPGPDSDQAHDILRVRAAMATLDPELAELLNLHYAEGNSCFEIGKLQGKLAATVTVQLFRARSELKKALLKQERNHGTQETKIDRSDSAGLTEAFES